MSGRSERLCKRPSENRKFAFDFTNVFVGSDEKITGIAEISSTKADGSASDLSITTTGISNTGLFTTMFIASGTNGQIYNVEALVRTTNGQTIEADGTLWVRE